MNEHSTENDALLTKPPQRPHHWMNAGGFCHAGEMFEAGTPAIPLYTAEQMEAWVRAERQALLASVIPPAMSVREQVVALVADLAQTLSDPTQAWDIAVHDFNSDINRLVKQEET